MGVDVWVRRPGGPLAAGVWGAEASVGAEVIEGVPAASELMGPEVMSSSALVQAAAEPTSPAPAPLSTPPSRAPLEPVSADAADRWDALRTEVLREFRIKLFYFIPWIAEARKKCNMNIFHRRIVA